LSTVSVRLMRELITASLMVLMSRFKLTDNASVFATKGGLKKVRRWRWEV
jgi:hypothetical protein